MVMTFFFVLIRIIKTGPRSYVSLEVVQPFADVGQAVETTGVLSGEKHRYDVPPAFYGLGYECFLPVQICYPAFDEPLGTQYFL